MSSERVRSDDRWNFACMLGDAVGFWLGYSFVAPLTIITFFISHLTESNLVIGAIPGVVALAWMAPQLVGANLVRRVRRRKTIVIITALVGRIALAVLIVGTWLFATTRPELVLWLTFAMVGLFRMMGGLHSPAGLDLIGKVIRPEMRGRFFGLAQGLGGGIGALGVWLAWRLLGQYPFPVNFVLEFSVAVFLMMLHLVPLALVREPLDKAPAKPVPFWAESAQAPALLRGDVTYSRFLLARIAIGLGTLGMGLLAVYGVRRFGADDQAVAGFTAVLLGSQTAASLLFGWVADRRGAGLLLQASALSAGLAMATAALAPSTAWLTLGFVFVGIALGGTAVGDPAAILQLGGTERRAVYVALTNTIVGPVLVAAPIVGGLAADYLGYSTTFILGLGAAIIGFVAIRWGVALPKRAR